MRQIRHIDPPYGPTYRSDISIRHIDPTDPTYSLPSQASVHRAYGCAVVSCRWRHHPGHQEPEPVQAGSLPITSTRRVSLSSPALATEFVTAPPPTKISQTTNRNGCWRRRSKASCELGESGEASICHVKQYDAVHGCALDSAGLTSRDEKQHCRLCIG